jgi:hypothetical protein
MMLLSRDYAAVRTILLVVLLTIAATPVTFPQVQTNGEIAGTISTREGAMLPGVRVVVKSRDDERREAITDPHGRFKVSGLKLGTYEVHAEIPGFFPASGSITLSDTTSRAHLAWSLDLGCLSEDVRVKMHPRQAAPLAEAIVHVRLTSADGPIVLSMHPACDGKIVESYTGTVLRRLKGQASGDEGALQLLLHRTDARLKSGVEYLALLWAGGYTDDTLVLPVESGRVMASAPDALGGMTVEGALKTLAQWAREPRR